MRTLLIGIGNPMRGDDGLGCAVAAEFACGAVRDGFQFVSVHQLTPELSELASQADRVIFVDAAHDGEPGTVQCRRVLPESTLARHSHTLSPATLLRMAESLYDRCPAACLITVVGETFSFGESLSAAVSAAVPGLLDQIQRLLDLDSWEKLPPV